MPGRSSSDACRAVSCTIVLTCPAVQQIPDHTHVTGRDLPSSHQPSDGYAAPSRNSIVFKLLALHLGINVIAAAVISDFTHR